MGKRGRKSKSSSSSSSPEDEPKQLAMCSDSDDAEANEDLSLKIVEKALQRANTSIDDVVLKEPRKSKKEKKRKKKKEEDEEEKEEEENKVSREILHSFKVFCSNMIDEDEVKEEENKKTCETTDVVDNTIETNSVEKSDNSVLRKLLRGPRYFDPPDTSWGACYNCGEEGHTTANCTSARRKKPCFVCGSLEHNVKQCTKGKNCFICKKEGHRAKDCSEKSNGVSQSSKICLKCGDSGHDMFSCRQNYHPDDLKLIQCYICKNFGHLCCAEYPDDGPREISCYRCGSLGHTGLACYGETSGLGLLSSCYRCGEGGHFARECIISKSKKKSRESSTPKKKATKFKDENKESRSLPSDFGKKRKKKTKYESVYRSEHKAKRRGGWVMDDPEDYSAPYHWRSPSSSWKYNENTEGHNRYPWSSGKSQRLKFSPSSSTISPRNSHIGFLASRFSSSSHGGTRHYDW